MRLDIYLTEHGLAKSRSYAASLIKDSRVTVNGAVVLKPSYDVTDEKVCVTGELYPYVGRGGVKLEYALDTFGIDPSGMTAVDIGASTGGFTDCLLSRGAAKVYAVDSGHGQLDKKLSADPRVINSEGFNAKFLGPDSFGTQFDIAVCDVSFISQTHIIGGVGKTLREGGYYVSLIKPQFECGRSSLGKGGVIKNSKYYYEAVKKIVDYSSEFDLGCFGLARSPIKGGDGNSEFLAAFRKGVGVRVTDELLKEVTL